MNKILKIQMSAVIVKILLGVAILVASFFLTGCAQTPTQVTTTPESKIVEFPDLDITITFYYAKAGESPKIKEDNHNDSDADILIEKETDEYEEWLNVSHENIRGNSSVIKNKEFIPGKNHRITIKCEEVTRIGYVTP